MVREAWWATVSGVAKSQTQLSDYTFTFLKYISGVYITSEVRLLIYR